MAMRLWGFRRGVAFWGGGGLDVTDGVFVVSLPALQEFTD